MELAGRQRGTGERRLVNIVWMPWLITFHCIARGNDAWNTSVYDDQCVTVLFSSSLNSLTSASTFAMPG